MRSLILIAWYTLHASFSKKIPQLACSLACLSYLFILWAHTTILGTGPDLMLHGICIPYQLFIWLYLFAFFIPWLASLQEHSYPYFLVRIERSTMIYGTILGASITILLAGIFLELIGALLAWYLYKHTIFYLTPAFISIFFEGIFLLSSAFLVSNFLSMSFCYGTLIAWYILAYAQQDWMLWLNQQPKSLIIYLGNAFSYLLPNLSALDIKSEIIYNVPYSFFHFIGGLLYTLFFSFILITIGLHIFEQKNL